MYHLLERKQGNRPIYPASKLKLLDAFKMLLASLMDVSVVQAHCLEAQLQWELWDVAASPCTDLELFPHSFESFLSLYTTLCSTGHEHPFSIALNCLRDSADQQQGTNNNTLLADGTEASFLDQLPKEKQCQFVLKPRLQAPVQLRRGRGRRSALQPGRDFAACCGSDKLFQALYTCPRVALIPERMQREHRGAIFVCANRQN